MLELAQTLADADMDFSGRGLFCLFVICLIFIVIVSGLIALVYWGEREGVLKSPFSNYLRYGIIVIAVLIVFAALLKWAGLW